MVNYFPNNGVFTTYIRFTVNQEGGAKDAPSIIATHTLRVHYAYVAAYLKLTIFKLRESSARELFLYKCTLRNFGHLEQYFNAP